MSSRIRSLRRKKLFAALIIAAATASLSFGQLRISQVYGGGGNTGATLKNDFIEVFNAGAASVSVSGMSVQYASTAGSSWAVTALPSLSLAPGQYLLVQEAQGAGGTTNLPTPDATGTIAMAAGAGKVALVNGTTALTGTCPTTNVVDFVGYGTGTNCFEGSGPTATIAVTTAAFRNGGGCVDSNNNSADFTVATANPRNTASPANPCGATPLSGTGAATPSSVQQGNSTLLTVAVTPGTNPASTGITVTVDLSSIGGSSTQQFFDNGTNGDVTIGNNVFSFQATVSAGTSPGAKTLTATIGDAQSRSASASIALTVTAISPSTPPTGTGSAVLSSVPAGGTTQLTVNVTPGTNPASTNIAVTGDLSAIGGSPAQAFPGSGNTFSFLATVDAATTPGAKSLPITVSDAEGTQQQL
jgi:hypothetical protein